MLHNFRHGFLKQVDDFLTASIVLWQCLQNLRHGHDIPPKSAPPGVLALTCCWVGPEHLVRLVPGMLPKVCLRVEGAQVGLRDLVNGIVVVLIHLLALHHVGGS